MEVAAGTVAVAMAVGDAMVFAILAAGDWFTAFFAGMRDWAAFPLPRDAMICDLFMYQNQNLYYTSK